MRSPDALSVRVSPDVSTTALVYLAAKTTRVGAALILAHGAGAGQYSGFIVRFARALSALGLDLITFNFLYTEQQRRLPDRAPLLEACYRSVIDAAKHSVESASQHLLIGGKSMGGRIATQVAASDRSVDVAGLVLLGYPLHPPGRPAQRRDAHLPAIERPLLFIQGGRDAFGTPTELEPVLARLGRLATLHVVDGGDHSFKVPGKDTARQESVYEDIQRVIVEWARPIAS